MYPDRTCAGPLRGLPASNELGSPASKGLPASNELGSLASKGLPASNELGSPASKGLPASNELGSPTSKGLPAIVGRPDDAGVAESRTAPRQKRVCIVDRDIVVRAQKAEEDDAA